MIWNVWGFVMTRITLIRLSVKLKSQLPNVRSKTRNDYSKRSDPNFREQVYEGNVIHNKNTILTHAVNNAILKRITTAFRLINQRTVTKLIQ